MPTSDTPLQSLMKRLKSRVGEAHCLTDPSAIAPYLVEPRGLFQGQALAVVRPPSAEAVAEVARESAALGVPIVAQGGNTGMCGGGVPDGGPSTVVVSAERLTRIPD